MSKMTRVLKMQFAQNYSAEAERQRRETGIWSRTIDGNAIDDG